MNWLDELMIDIDIELLIEKCELDIKHADFRNWDSSSLRLRLDRLEKARSPEMLARIELDWAPKQIEHK